MAIWLTLLALSPAAWAAPLTLLHDQFAATYLSGGDDPDLEVYSANHLPESTAWYMSYPMARTSATSTVVFSPNTGMTLRDTGGGTTNVMGYFTNDRTEFVNLAVGESIELTFTFSAKNPVNLSSGFAMGFLNSNGTQVADGFYSLPAVTAKSFEGYVIFSNFVNVGNWNTTLNRRHADENDSLYATNAMDQNFTGDFHNDGLALSSDTIYAASLTITRTDVSENRIQFSLNGVTLDAIDNAPYTTFDSINFNFQTQASDGITINDIKVVYSQIPEPGTAGLGLAAVILGWMSRRRRALEI